MPKLTIPAAIENIPTAIGFLDKALAAAGCPFRAQMQLDVALDELMSNVARYAYAPRTGEITIEVEILEDPRRVVLTLSDSGVPYDPLQKEDPDVTLSAEARGDGGLGIFIVKKTMDVMSYAFKNGRNVVSLEKILR